MRKVLLISAACVLSLLVVWFLRAPQADTREVQRRKRGVMKKFAFGAVVGGVVVYIAMAATVTELMEKIEAMGKQK